ncbi:hypothetical protein IT412_05360 [Candidatus Peregrinibacteria bacterium]|nr:hypothetical protein [Candidatus Peregrinibacteria bacterium]
MAAEQQNKYIEDAKLNEPMTEKEVGIMKDPSKFDEAALRKEFTDRLDKARGGKMIESASLLKKYGDALNKIEDNIKRLKDVADYAIQKNKALKAVDSVDKHAKVDNNVGALFLQFDFADIQKFKDLKVTNVLCYVDRQVISKKLDSAQQTISAKLDKYFTNFIATVGEKSINEVKSAEKGMLPFVTFTDIRYDLEDLQDQMADKFVGTSNPNKFIAAAKERIFVLEAYYKLALDKLGTYDRGVVANLDAAKKARKAKVEGAKGWEAGANEVYFMNMEKGIALIQKQKAADKGAEGGLFLPGDKFFKEAMSKSGTSFAKAAELFKKATRQYELAAAIAERGGGKKPNTGYAQVEQGKDKTG